MLKPVAVLISDVHYSVHTLKLADAATRMSIDKANELEVPLIVAGDLHDTKANLRGECVNAMLETFSKCAEPPYILIGNHDRLNEKAHAHSLNFLAPLARLVTEPRGRLKLVNSIATELLMLPYYHDPEELKAYLKTIPKGSTIIMHQGVQNSNSGDYIQDKSALPRECFADFRVISGHYHQRQDIKCGRPQKGSVGLFSYIGNPYTLSYGEANDPPKGFQILMDDGSLEFVPTNLRRHIIHECDAMLLSAMGAPKVKSGDLLWIKMRGTKEQLQLLPKSKIIHHLYLDDFQINFKYDQISTDTKTQVDTTLNLSQGPLLDSLIDSLYNTSDERKTRLKQAWKDLI